MTVGQIIATIQDRRAARRYWIEAGRAIDSIHRLADMEHGWLNESAESRLERVATIVADLADDVASEIGGRP